MVLMLRFGILRRFIRRVIASKLSFDVMALTLLRNHQTFSASWGTYT